MDDIRASLERVRERVARAAERVGRRAEDVLLIGVSKTVEPARIREAIAAGVPALGENRAQEARATIAELGRLAIPPAALDPAGARVWFRTLAKLGERHALRELSMGMSGDFEVAIEEGATMVRVGTAIFGPRAAGPPKEPRER